jgi:hypothetical protein
MIIDCYEVRPRKDKRGVDLISDALPFGRLWYGEQNAINNALGCAEHFNRSHQNVAGAGINVAQRVATPDTFFCPIMWLRTWRNMNAGDRPCTTSAPSR